MCCQSVFKSIKQDLKDLVQTFCCCLVNGDQFTRCLPILLFVLQVVFLVLQAVGTGTRQWVFSDTCGWSGLQDSCKLDNLLNSSNSTPGTSDTVLPTGHTVYSLEIASLVIQGFCLLVGVFAMIRFCAMDSDENESLRTFCFICFLPFLSSVSGFINFVGCMIAVHAGLTLGYSFYLCLSASLGSMTSTSVAMVGYCCIKAGKCR